MNWQKEWGRRTAIEKDDRFGAAPVAEDNLYDAEDYPESQWELDPEKVKAFISDLIDKERKEAVREYDREVFEISNNLVSSMRDMEFTLDTVMRDRKMSLVKRGIDV